jgi:GNAT superfamily N-acetyltransferase
MISFRKATLDDIDTLITMRIDFINEIPPVVEHTAAETAELSDKLRDYLTQALQKGEFISWLAIESAPNKDFSNESESIVATSGLCFYSLPPSFKNTTGNVAYIMNMYTLSNYRGRGIAQKLLHFLMDETRNRGIKKLTLQATEMGLPIYEKLGFKVLNTEMVMFL